jgi:hypothetical protein
LASAAKYDALAAKARAEAADFDAAERVWVKLFADIDADADDAAAVLMVPHHGKKPAEVPSVPDMIVEILKGGERAGMLGMTPTELLNQIRIMWWSGAQNSDVGPTAWRMWKDGRLVKPNPDSAVYALPKPKNSPPAPLLAEQEVMPG